MTVEKANVIEAMMGVDMGVLVKQASKFGIQAPKGIEKKALVLALVQVYEAEGIMDLVDVTKMSASDETSGAEPTQSKGDDAKVESQFESLVAIVEGQQKAVESQQQQISGMVKQMELMTQSISMMGEAMSKQFSTVGETPMVETKSKEEEAMQKKFADMTADEFKEAIKSNPELLKSLGAQVEEEKEDDIEKQDKDGRWYILHQGKKIYRDTVNTLVYASIKSKYYSAKNISNSGDVFERVMKKTGDKLRDGFYYTGEKGNQASKWTANKLIDSADKAAKKAVKTSEKVEKKSKKKAKKSKK